MNRVFATHAHLAERIAERGDEWGADFKKTWLETTADGVWFDADAARVVANKHIQKDWPGSAKILVKLAKHGDTGLGDVVQRLVGKFGGERFKRVYKNLMGHDCGCSDRQAKINAKYPIK